MTQPKNGRKPLPTGKQAPAANPYGAYYAQDLLQLDPKLAAEIDAKGLEHRWIDANEFVARGNMHNHYWRPYKREAKDSENGSAILESDWKFGNDPEGFIRRKGLVLAVRPKEVGDGHRFMLEDKSKRQHGGLRRRQADEMREHARKAGVRMPVEEDDDN